MRLDYDPMDLEDRYDEESGPDDVCDDGGLLWIVKDEQGLWRVRGPCR